MTDMAENADDLKHPEEQYFQKADNLIHNSCPVLRSIFRRRWEHETGSSWSEASIEKFIAGIGKEFYETANQLQRKCLESGRLEEWDMSFMWNLLKRSRWEKNDQESKSLRKKENQAIEKLIQLRNQSAHSSIKKLNEEGYKEIEAIVRSQLEELGVSSKEIEGIVAKAGVLKPVSGWEAAEMIQKDGDENFEMGEYSKAIQLYSDALQVPNLLAKEKSVLLEKRARSTLALMEGLKPSAERTTRLDEAKVDVRKSLEYNNDSWRAHQIMGKIFMHEHNYTSALEHLNRAQAISPGQNDVKSDLDRCKYSLGRINRMEHLEQANSPTTIEEQLETFANETGGRMTKDTLLQLVKKESKSVPGTRHVVTGHRYFDGWDVAQNYLKASKHYAKASKLGNALGTYMLSVLYLNGLGVEQCIPRAFELLKKAANTPPEKFHFGYQVLRSESSAVANAQHTLGLLYQEGVHVTKDLKTAAKWYKKGAMNGAGNAANNLGNMYAEGEGVEFDEEKAVMYWRLGVRMKEKCSARALFISYRQQMEPKLARIMFDRAIALGDEELEMHQQPIYYELFMAERWRESIEPQVVAFERENNLSGNHMTFHDRMIRKFEGNGKQEEKLVKLAKRIETTSITKWGGKVTNVNFSDLAQEATSGSETAKRLLSVLCKSLIIDNMFAEESNISEEQSERLIDLLYDCLVTEYHFIQVSEASTKKILGHVDNLLRLHGNSESELDRRIRVCFSWGRSDTLEEMEILKVGLERYPEESFFYDMLSSLHGKLQNHESGLEMVEKGLLRFPNHVQLLYKKAASMADMSSILKAYNKFFEYAPSDYRKVPEAYYALATCYIQIRDYDRVQHFYSLGLDAEKHQLSCYLPYESISKTLVEYALQLVKLEESSENVSSAEDCKQRPKSSKRYLEDPWRLIRIRHHRKAFQQLRKDMSLFSFSASYQPRLEHQMPPYLNYLKSIKLIEIDETKEGIYEDCILNLTLIDNPIIGVLTAIQALAEDENGDVVRLSVYNVPRDAEHAKRFGFGSRLSVINPYLRIGREDQQSCIRVDDPKCIIYNEGMYNMCRYCGEKDARKNCVKCKWANYCSRDCQTKDWYVFKHELICWRE